MNRLTVLLPILVFVLAVPLAADVIVDVPAYPNYPGLQGGSAVSDSVWQAQRFSLSGPYDNVHIWAQFSNFWTNDLTLQWFLTTQIGPGTDPSLHEVASGSFNLAPVSGDYLLLVSGLTLAPGGYYLSVGNTTCPGAGSCGAWPNYSPLSGPVIGDVASGTASGPPALSGYIPAETYFFLSNSPYVMRVTGDPIPEPSTHGLIAMGMLLTIAWKHLRG